MNVQRASVAGLVLTAVVSTVAVVQLSGERAAQITGDFRNAAVAEVRNSASQVLLRGTFVAVDADDAGEVERHAKLESMVAGATLSGEAEVEYQTDQPANQEVELSVKGVTAGSQVTLVIDGTTVTTATADKRGHVSVELDVRATP
jgi:hypothetical protein